MVISGDNTTRRNSRQRVLVIGWDGATFDLLDSLATQGIIPNLGKIMREGFRTVLLSTIPPISAPAWTTLMTGMNPGQHGILNFVETKPVGAQEHEENVQEAIEVFPGGYSVVNATCINVPTLWQRLSLAGKRIGVINMPMTYPPVPVNGFMICGMLTPPGAANYTYPLSLAGELGDYEVELGLEEREFDYPPDRLIARLTEVSRKRGETVLRFIQEEPWDAFFVVFTGTDRIQHRFWDTLKPSSEMEAGSGEATGHRALLHDYYRLLDDLLGQLMSAGGDDVVTILMSDHGFGPIGSRSVHRRAMARTLGLESSGGQSWPVRLRSCVEGRLGLSWLRVRRILARVMPRKWLQLLEQRMRSHETEAQQQALAAIVPFVGHLGGIYINRDRVEDHTMAAFKETLSQRMQELVDPQTGEKLVTEVWPHETLYHGKMADECPDLVFALNPAYVLAGGVGRNGGMVGPRTSHPLLRGSHRREAVLLVTGPVVRPGAGSKAYRLEDITATVMALLELPIPENLDGRPVEEALEDLEWTLECESAEHLLIGLEQDNAWASEDEAAAVLERLRGIGYID